MIAIVFILIVLGLIVYQDFRFRHISWWVLPLLLAFLILDTLRSVVFSTIVTAVTFNLFFILLELFVTTLYFSLKYKKWTFIINNKIGLGDVLFFIVLAVYFSTPAYILFFMVCLLVSLLAYPFISLWGGKHNKQVPLAGIASLLLISSICIFRVVFNLSFYNISYLANIFVK